MNPFTSIIAHGLVGQTVQVHTLAGHGLVGQTVQVHTLAGQFAGTLEALIGGVVRIRGGGTVYDVDLAHVVAISYPTPAPAPAPTSTYYFSLIDGHRVYDHEVHPNGQGRAA